MQPDQLDWKIINVLSKKHIPNSTLAKKLQVSEGTVRQRLKKLQKKEFSKSDHGAPELFRDWV